MGWQLFRAETYVNWCGHGQEVVPLPLEDGRVTFVPVPEEEEGAGGAGGGSPNDLASAKAIRQWPEGVGAGGAKDPESPYVPGRTLKWLKVKVKDYRKEERGFYRE